MSILKAPTGFKCGLRYRVRYAAVGEPIPLEFIGAFIGSVHTHDGWIANFSIDNNVWPVHHCALMVCTPVPDITQDISPYPINSPRHTRHMRAGRIGVMRSTTDTPTHRKE